MQIINQPGPSNGDETLFVEFYMAPVRNNHKSEQAGRPIFDDVTHVRIQAPGDMLTVVEREAWDGDKRRFPRQWQAFEAQQAGREELSGTPISTWPALSRSQVEELRALKFYTVEQIANASDQQLQRIGMGGFGLRTTATAYLESATNSALAQQQATELARRDQQIAELQEQIARLASAVDDKRGPGRPRKEAA